MAVGDEDPGTRDKILQESWSILSRDTLDISFSQQSFPGSNMVSARQPYLMPEKNVARLITKCVSREKILHAGFVKYFAACPELIFANDNSRPAAKTFHSSGQ